MRVESNNTVKSALLVGALALVGCYASGCSTDSGQASGTTSAGGTVGGTTGGMADVPNPPDEGGGTAVDVPPTADEFTPDPCTVHEDCTIPEERRGECLVAMCEDDTGVGRCTLVVVQAGGLCDDGSPCTSNDTCLDDVCSGLESCDDADPCTSDGCSQNGDCEHTLLPECCSTDDECQDGDPCNGAENCLDHLCVAGAPMDCDDGSACTTDSCVDGECDHTPVAGCCADDGECDDGDACNGAEQCVSNVCESGAPLTCDDGNDCTTDTCGAGGCQSQPIAGCCTTDQDCDDGDPCNGEESCGASVCQSGLPVQCASASPCLAASCDPATGACVETPVAGCCTTDADCGDLEQCVDQSCQSAANGCSGGMSIVVPWSGSGDTSQSDDSFAGGPSCSDGGIGGDLDGAGVADDVYSFVAPTSGSYPITLTVDSDSGTPDFVYVITDCADAAGTCVDSSGDIWGGGDFEFQLQGGGLYHVVVDGDVASQEGPYTLTIEVPPSQCSTNADCDDSDPCTSDSCNSGNCVHAQVPNCCATSDFCNDGDPCNGEESCVDQLCVAGAPLDCDDGSACTTDSCVDGECAHAPVAGCCADDGECDDGDACNGSEQCVSNVCEPGEPMTCDDGNDCTTDTCGGGGCQYQPIAGCCTSDSECDDGDPCNGEESCGASVCQSGMPVQCASASPCLASSCDPATGACVETPVAGCCTTDADCGDSEQCVDQSCQSVAMGCPEGMSIVVPWSGSGDTSQSDDSFAGGPSCSDGGIGGDLDGAGVADDVYSFVAPTTGSYPITLTVDSDSGTPDFVYVITDCADAAGTCVDSSGDIWGGGDFEFQLQAGSLYHVVVDGDIASQEGPYTLTIEVPQCSAHSDCDDTDPCTADSCNSGSCVHASVPNCCATSDSCNDGDACNGEESCLDHVCVAGAPLDCDDGSPCTTDSCGNGACVHTPVADCCLNDGECDDGDACNGSEQCVSNVCGPGEPLTCDDGDQCTTDTCAAGACQSEPIAGCCTTDPDCDDGDPCNGAEACVDHACAAGVPMDCNDGQFCTVDECGAGGCSNQLLPGCCEADADCADSDPCNGAELCVDHQCTVGPPLNCDDGQACTDDSCGDTGCVYVPVADCCETDAQCSDDDACTGQESCMDHVCEPGAPMDCDDADPCTSDECAGGACVHVPIAGCGGPAPFCVLAGDVGDSVSCPLRLAVSSASSPPATGLQFKASYDGELAALDKFACPLPESGFDQCATYDVTPSKHSITTNPVKGEWDGFVSVILYKASGPEPITPAYLQDGEVVGDDLVFNLVFTLNASTGGAVVELSDVVASEAEGFALSVEREANLFVTSASATNECTTDADCADDDACTIDTCDSAGSCAHADSPGCCNTDGDCGDGDECNGVESCVDHVCAAGVPVDCADDDECTVDSCVAGACTNETIVGCGGPPPFCVLSGAAGETVSCDLLLAAEAEASPLVANLQFKATYDPAVATFEKVSCPDPNAPGFDVCDFTGKTATGHTVAVSSKDEGEVHEVRVLLFHDSQPQPLTSAYLNGEGAIIGDAFVLTLQFTLLGDVAHATVGFTDPVLSDSAATPLAAERSANLLISSAPPAAGCVSDADCGDADPCTQDACGPDGGCSNHPVAGCTAGSPDLHINTFLPGDQREPNLAGAADGRFVAIWMSDEQVGSGSELFGQRFAPDASATGPEFQISATEASWLYYGEEHYDVDMTPDGRFVVSWAASDSEEVDRVYARLFDANGEVDGDWVVDDQSDEYTQYLVAVSVEDDGAFVSCFDFGAGFTTGLKCRYYASDGSAEPSQWVSTTSNPHNPRLDSNGAGAQVLAWHRGDINTEVWAQPLTNGVASGPVIHVNVTTDKKQENADVAVSGSGAFAVTWESTHGAAPRAGYVRLFGSDGSPQTGEILLSNPEDEGYVEFVGIAAGPAGNYLTVWSGDGGPFEADSSDVWSRPMSGSGDLGEIARLNSVTGSVQDESVVISAGPHYVAAWTDWKQENQVDGSHDEGVFGRVIAAP